MGTEEEFCEEDMLHIVECLNHIEENICGILFIFEGYDVNYLMNLMKGRVFIFNSKLSIENHKNFLCL